LLLRCEVATPILLLQRVRLQSLQASIAPSTASLLLLPPLLLLLLLLLLLQVFIAGRMVLGTNKMKTATHTPRATGDSTAADTAADTAAAATEAPMISQQAAAGQDSNITPSSSSSSSSRQINNCSGAEGLAATSRPQGLPAVSSRVQQRCQGLGELLQQLPQTLLMASDDTAQHLMGAEEAAAAKADTAVSPPPAAAAATFSAGDQADYNQKQQQQQQQQQSAHAVSAPGSRERLLCRVLTGVLNASGVLTALLSLQQLDAVDVAGIEPLYLQLLQQQQGKQQGKRQGKQQDQEQQQEQEQQGQHGQHGQQQQERQQQQQQEGQLAQQQQQLQVLRDYLTAATAKDCALMITLQQVLPQQQQQQQQLQAQLGHEQGQQGLPPDGYSPLAQQEQQQKCGSKATHSSASRATQGTPHGSSSSSSSSSQAGSPCSPCRLFHDKPSGCVFAWRLSVVDLDLKPVSKVPTHADLDRAIVQAAQQQGELLRQHVGDSAQWVQAACAWLDRVEQ
jgi:hypothetical protein